MTAKVISYIKQSIDGVDVHAFTVEDGGEHFRYFVEEPRPGRPIACSPYGAGVTTRNAVRCLHCDDVIESLHRHDFKRCRCGHVTVDGGPEYKRRLWSGDPSWNEIDHDGNEGVPIVDVVLDREDRR